MNSKAPNENPVFQIGILFSMISECLTRPVDLRPQFVMRFTVSNFSPGGSHRCILIGGWTCGGRAFLCILPFLNSFIYFKQDLDNQQ
jgi:hypothetical protein